MKHIHLIGIGGTGLSAIARILSEMGYTVTGSDRAESSFTRDLQSMGVTINIGHRPENVAGADLVVRSSAIPDDNPEIVAARAAGVPVLKRADFLGSLMEGKTGIAVAGTHGKTTTTSMIAWMLTALGQNPSFISGGVLANLKTNARFGKGKVFVVEADEYDRMFLGLKPTLAVVTSVEHDHPDCFPTPVDYQAAFMEFVKRLPANGVLVACATDAGACALMTEAKKLNKTVIAYGLQQETEDRQEMDVYAGALAFDEAGNFTFDANVLGAKVTVKLQVPGKHNVLNALAALAVAKLLDLSLAEAAQALGQFRGTGRRFEILGEVDGIAIIDDYAHHPTEIRATLAATRARYPDRRLWAVWQPHTYSRTKMLYDDFIHSFDDADEVIVTEIYAAREPEQDFSAKQIVNDMTRPTHFMASLPEASNYLLSHLRSGDVLLVLSAGDANRVSSEVLAHLEKTENG